MVKVTLNGDVKAYFKNVCEIKCNEESSLIGSFESSKLFIKPMIHKIFIIDKRVQNNQLHMRYKDSKYIKWSIWMYF